MLATLKQMFKRGGEVELVPHTTIKEEFKSSSVEIKKSLEEILAKNSIITSEDMQLLQSLGFLQVPDISETEKIETEQKRAKSLLERFSKLEAAGFIVVTRDWLRTEILQKYKLICGPSGAFLRNIPAENIIELKDAVDKYLKMNRLSPSYPEVVVVSPVFDFKTWDNRYSFQGSFLTEMPSGDPIILLKDYYNNELLIYATGWDVEKEIFLEEYNKYKKNHI